MNFIMIGLLLREVLDRLFVLTRILLSLLSAALTVRGAQSLNCNTFEIIFYSDHVDCC